MSVAKGSWGRRLLLGFCLGMLVLLLLVDGFTTKTVGAAGTGARSFAGSSLAGSAPVLVANGRGGLISHQPPPGKRIALTFDDGPNPTWTPKIAAVLLAEHVPATFFEVGSQVVRYPDMTRMLHRDGFELGNHTFTHADISSLPNWEAKLQVSLTESSISGLTGIRPRLVRPPYSSTTEAVTPAQERSWGAMAATGHMIAVANYDTQDWERPGVSTIVSNVLSEPSDKARDRRDRADARRGWQPLPNGCGAAEADRRAARAGLSLRDRLADRRASHARRWKCPRPPANGCGEAHSTRCSHLRAS